MRVLWFAAGAGASLYAMAKARRAAEAFTPDGARDRLAGLQVGWQLFEDEVRAGMVEKETDLRERLVLGLDESRLLPPTGGSHRADTTPQQILDNQVLERKSGN